MDIALVLDRIRPGAAWRRSDTYDNLVATWEDTEQVCPLLEEIEAAWEEMQVGPTIEELKMQKWDKIKAERDRREQSGLPYMEKILDSDTLSVQRISIAVQAAQAAIAAEIEFTVDWTCADNSVLTMTAQEIVGIPVALAQHSDRLHQIARGLREQIEAAVTAAELDLIVWPE